MIEVFDFLEETGEMAKGIFWFTCSFTEENECDFSETELIALPIPCDSNGHPAETWQFNSKNGTSFTHKATWRQLVHSRKDLRKFPWNYFPRGRVEIRNHKAMIFVNPNIIKCDSYQQRIIEEFHLRNIKVKVLVDNSVHYYCHADTI